MRNYLEKSKISCICRGWHDYKVVGCVNKERIKKILRPHQTYCWSCLFTRRHVACFRKPRFLNKSLGCHHRKVNEGFDRIHGCLVGGIFPWKKNSSFSMAGWQNQDLGFCEGRGAQVVGRAHLMRQHSVILLKWLMHRLIKLGQNHPYLGGQNRKAH